MKTKPVVIAAILAGGTLFVAIIVLCAGAFYWGYRSTDGDISPKIDVLFASMEDGTFVENYDTETASELRDTVSQQQFRQMGEMIHGRLGSLIAKNLTSYNFRQFNADTYVEVKYDATFEKGEGEIQAKFKKVDDQWRLLRLHVDSPVFKQDLETSACPHCGETHTGVARFCPHCGKPLTDLPDNADPDAPAIQDQ